MALAAVCGGVSAVQGASAAARPAAAAATPARSADVMIAPHHVRLPAGERQVCPDPSRPAQMTCMTIVRTGAAAAGASSRGYGPAALRSAYNLAVASGRDGRGRTVAIVDPYRDPDAAANLAAYRAHFGLPPCGQANGCLRIVNANGKGGRLPKANAAWALTQAQALDMVSAICPHCRILLVEARTTSLADLGKAENTAVALGAKFVSNGWAGSEFLGQQQYDHFFNHPGVAITAAAGDAGFGPAYPASSPYVTAVGGNSLSRVHTRRGWTETVWAATGSGCSTFEPKPSWQTVDAKPVKGCLNRTGNDLSADADPLTGVAVYDTYHRSGWLDTGGTNVSAAIIAAAYALAGDPAPGTYPASYPYRRAAHFHHVLVGSNGVCDSTRQYLCHGRNGYNGPGGLGSPDGVAGLAAGGVRRVTLVDPGVQDQAAGTGFSLRIAGLDARTGAASLSYTATGLPAGLSISAVPHSTDGLISGTLPGSPGVFTVTVKATDPRTGQTGSARFAIVAIAPAQPPAPAVTSVTLSYGGMGLEAGNYVAGQQVVVSYRGTPGFGQWQYIPLGTPGGPGELKLYANADLCLDVAGGVGQLATCSPGAATQTFAYPGFSQLENPATGLCLGDPTHTSGDQVSLVACTGATDQTWTLSDGAVQSDVPGMCVSQPGYPYTGTATIAACGSLYTDFHPQSGGMVLGYEACLTGGRYRLDGQVVSADGCGAPNGPQEWVSAPNGELINVGSGLCLDDPGDSSASGTQLQLQDCYGLPGEFWAVY